MAEQQGSGEKTEAATPRRRERAIEKGDRPASRDLATALSGVAGGIWLAASGPELAAQLKTGLAAALAVPPGSAAAFHPVDALTAMLLPLAPSLLLLAVLLIVAAAAGQALAGGLAFNPGLATPRLDRLDPVKGLGRLFGSHGLIELAKALTKAVVLLLLSALVIADAMPRLVALGAVPLETAITSAADIGIGLFLWLVGGLALIAAADIPLQLVQWLKRLRMTRQDVHEEMKEQEGSAEVKMALRRMARDALKRSSRAAMAQATVVLTNPTHFAVALRYRPELDAAPLIVARGRGLVADVIRELADEQGIAVLSYPSVARALYFTGRVGSVIRTDLYAAVATILAFVLRVGGGHPAPDVEAPPGACYDEHGRRSG